MQSKAFFVTIPHSGESVPQFCTWLKQVPEVTLMRDVDRYVDVLYKPCIDKYGLDHVLTEWHRYAGDLNRLASDVDVDSVIGSANKSGEYTRGFHWVKTTHGEVLMPAPMPEKMHQELVELIYEPFHQSVRNHYEKFKKQGHKKVYHLDLHSMPSKGTAMHRDPGEYRADVVISDCKGKSSDAGFVDLVIAAYSRAGFKVAYNWPYFGGRVSEQYGAPDLGQHAVQVELNRALYMSEETQKLLDSYKLVQEKLDKAISYITSSL